MKLIGRITGVVCGIAVLSCMLACGSVRQAAADQKRGNDMKQVGLAYLNFHDSKMKGPSDANEFATFVQSDPGDPNAARLASEIRSGSIIVQYGAKLSQDFPQGTSITVLAYESNVPSAGGWVIMGDASVRKMTPAEFAAAPKPGKGGDKKDK